MAYEERSYVDSPDWISAGDPITGDSGEQEGVANQVVRQLHDSLENVRRNNLVLLRPSHKVITTPTGGGDDASLGDFFVVNTTAATRINLPSGQNAGDSVRVKRLASDSGVVAAVSVYRGTTVLVDATSWPVTASPGSSVDLSGLSVDRQGAGDTDIEDSSARRVRVDDITFTWDGSEWNVQPTALVDSSVAPLLNLLLDLKDTLDTAISDVAGSIADASTSQAGLTRYADADDSRDDGVENRSVTPAGVDHALDAHEDNFDASTSQKGHVELATDSEHGQDNPPDDKAATPSGVKDYVTGRQSLWLPMEAWTARSANGADVLVNNVSDVDRPEVRAYVFDPGSVEYIECQVKLGKRWDRSEDFKARVYWTVAGTSTGSVRWGVRAAWLGNGENIQSADRFGLRVTVDDAHAGQSDALNISGETPDFSGSGNASEGDILFLQLQRVADHGSDTQTGDAQFIGLELFYETGEPTDD